MGDAQSALPMEAPARPISISSPSLSSISSEDSGDDEGLRDPHLVTLHFVTDPGQGSVFKQTIRPLIQGHDPAFKLFNVAERSRTNTGACNASIENRVPALAVMIFMQYTDDDGKDDTRIVHAQTIFDCRPWKLHHSSSISGNRILCEPNFQDFYWLDPEMPLWAVRQVHYGNEHLRFMLYSTSENWTDMVRFYSLLLSRKAEYEREGFCYFLVHTKNGTDIQLAMKEVPPQNSIKPLNSAFLQFKVREIGRLVPLLPNACSPLSSQRWQTTDPSGNVTLLLVSRKAHTGSGHTTTGISPSIGNLRTFPTRRARTEQLRAVNSKHMHARENVTPSIGTRMPTPL